jgi:hypothetical protein
VAKPPPEDHIKGLQPVNHEVTAVPEKLTPTEARQGEKQPIVRHVLVVSTILAVVALIVVYIFAV